MENYLKGFEWIFFVWFFIVEGSKISSTIFFFPIFRPSSSNINSPFKFYKKQVTNFLFEKFED